MALCSFLPLALTLAWIPNILKAQDCVPTASLVPLDTWQTIEGSYEEGGWAIYEMPMYLGVDYVFKTGCGDGASADHPTVIEWMTPQCTVIMGDDDGCAEGGAQLGFNSFFSDGIVLWVRVRGQAGEAGSFTLAYRSIGGAPGQCNSCPSYDADLAPSSLWQTVEGAYGADGCRVYRVFTYPGIEYTFKTGCGDGATADHDTHLELLGPGCGSLALDDNTCEEGRSSMTWTAGTQGSVWVKVNATDGAAGTFTLSYRSSGGNGSACAGCPTYDFTATPAFDWYTSSSSYLAGGCRIYRFIVTEGLNYIFKTGCGDGASADHDTRLELFDAECNSLAVDNDGCNDGASLIEHMATTTGFVYLRVSGTNEAHGFYTLAYKKGGLCMHCPAYDVAIIPTTEWQTASGDYLQDGCRIYRAEVTEGHTYVFQTACGNGAASDHVSVIQLLDGTCAPVAITSASNCDGLGERVFHHATATGVLYVKVHGLFDGFGSHTLAFRDVGASNDACGDAAPIQIGQGGIVLAGSVSGATADDGLDPASPLHGAAVEWYTLEVDDLCNGLWVSYCGQSPVWPNTIGMLAVECAGDSILYGTLGTCMDGNATYEFADLPPGTYHLPILFDPANSLDGHYRITVECAPYVVSVPEQASRAQWTVKPNPGHDEFWLEGHGDQVAPASVRIMDATGRHVAQSVFASFPARVEVGSLGAGLYMVHIQQGGTNTTVRWVKD